MDGYNKKENSNCTDCEHFLRMYKGAGVGTCRIGSKKYRSEDASCDKSELTGDVDLEGISSGYCCHGCGDDICDSDFTKEHSIGPFDINGKLIHYYCPDCWQDVYSERERYRRQFDVP